MTGCVSQPPARQPCVDNTAAQDTIEGLKPALFHQNVLCTRGYAGTSRLHTKTPRQKQSIKGFKGGIGRRRGEPKISRCFCSPLASPLHACVCVCVLCVGCVEWHPTFHPVHHLSRAPLAHRLHHQSHGRSLSSSRTTKERKRERKKTLPPLSNQPIPPPPPFTDGGKYR